MSAFEILNKINVNEHTEQKNGLTYLSWAWAWAEVKKKYPDANYEIMTFDGLPYVFDENTGYMVYTKVTIENITHMMWLPVMDGANKAMKSEPYKYIVRSYGKEVEKTVATATMFDINKTVMRCLVKNLAMFGLGLYIYAGEDLPEDEQPPQFDPEKVGEERIDQTKANALFNEADEAGVTPEQILKMYEIGSIYDMTEKQFSDCHMKLQKQIMINAKRGMKDGRENS